MESFTHSIKQGGCEANREVFLFEFKKGPGVITEQWFTGKGCINQDTVIRYYIDGDTAAPSIEVNLYMAQGIGYVDKTSDDEMNYTQYSIGTEPKSSEALNNMRFKRSNVVKDFGAWEERKSKIRRSKRPKKYKIINPLDKLFGSGVLGRSQQSIGDRNSSLKFPAQATSNEQQPCSTDLGDCPFTSEGDYRDGSEEIGDNRDGIVAKREDDPEIPWGSRRFGHVSREGGLYNTFRIPFQKSIFISMVSKTAGQYWYNVRGVRNYPLIIGDVELPPSATLKVYKKENTTVQPFDYISLASSISNHGMLYQVTFDTQSESFEHQEACFRVLANDDNEIQYLSSGTEDLFLSSYYYSGGVFHTDQSGLSYMDEPGRACAYKFFEDDPFFFSKSFELIWRCGELLDNNCFKSQQHRCIRKNGNEQCASQSDRDATANVNLRFWVVNFWIMNEKYKSKYTVNELAIKLLSSSHVIGLPNPRDPPQEIGEEAIRESEAYGILIKKLMEEPNLNLAVGGIIANEMRDAVLEKTQFTCSAGIAQNKMLAKLIAGFHKPNQQTVLFQEDLNALFDNVKMRKVRHLGGKLGETLHQTFKVEMMSDLARISTAELRQQFGEKTGDWLYLLGKGIDHEPVRPRQLPKSVGCCKNFRGKEKLAKVTEVSYWLNQLASEVCERLEQEVELNNRIPTHLCVNLSNSTGTSVSRSCGVSKFDAAQVTADALGIIKTFNKSQEPDTWDPPIVHLGLSASKFTEKTKSLTKSIRSFFQESATQLSQYDQSNGNVDRPDNAEPDYSTPVSELNSNHSHEMPSGKNRSGSTSKEKVTNRLTRFFNSVPRPVSSMSSHESLVHGEASQCSSRGRKKFSGIKQMSSSLVETNNSATRQTIQVNSFENYFDRSNIADMSCEELVSDSLTADDFTICKKCGRRVVAWELPEHNDFHFAEELQTSMNNNKVKNEAALGLSPPKKKIRLANYKISSFFKNK
eukprot:gene17317-19050_t